MKIIFTFSMIVLMSSCAKEVQIKEVASDNKASEDKCVGIVSNIIKKNIQKVSLSQVSQIDLADLSQEEIGCLPNKQEYMSGVERALSFMENNDDLSELDLFVIASVETYLKYGEAANQVAASHRFVKATNGSSAVPDKNIFASFETYLKYAEAVGVDDFMFRIGFSCAETYLKVLEAQALPTENITGVMGIETYAKVLEASGGRISDSSLQVRASMEKMLMIGEMLNENAFKYYSTNIGKILTGHWDTDLDDSGVIADGKMLWSANKPLTELLNISTLPATAETQLLDKGVMTVGLQNEHISFLNLFNKSKSFDQLIRILDKGIVVDKALIEPISQFNLNSDENIDRIIDKGIVVDNFDPSFENLALFYNEKSSFADLENTLDKGLLGTEKSSTIVKALIENGVATPSEVLDKGVLIEVSDGKLKIQSIMNYLESI